MKKLFLIALAVILAAGISSAQAPKNYHLKDLGMLPGMKGCEPTAMNNEGYVAGVATAGPRVHCAFLYYYNGKEEEMEDIGGLGSRAFAISPSGIVVGDSYFPRDIEISHAAIFKGGMAVDIGVLPGQIFSRATGINAARHVVGYSGLKRDSAESRGFIWTSTEGMIDLGTLGGSYTQAFAINEAGWVTGTSALNPWVKNGGTHAFIYQPIFEPQWPTKPMQDLGTLGGTSSWGTAINNKRHVVGYSTITYEPRVHAFFHNGEKMIDLGALEKEGFDYSAALAINSDDFVVGVSYFPATDRNRLNQAAFLWKGINVGSGGHEMVSLNTLLNAPDAERYWLLTAGAINDNGQIVATAFDRVDNAIVAVLLTPAK